MAQAFQSVDGTLIIPGAYPNIQVDTSTGGLSINGVLFLVGEADGGPDFSLETDLTKNWYGADQDAQVKAKYQSGRLVDGFLAAAVPSADTKLSGSPSRIYLVKTNPSGKAYKQIDNIAASKYHDLADTNFGELGNLLYFTIAQKTPETRPTTGQFSLMVPNNTTDLGFRCNGGAELSYQMTAADLPPVSVAGINALAGVSCTGGANRNILTVAGTLALAASGSQVTITRSVAWANNPSVGDTLYIPAGSVIEGGTPKNGGSYVITSVTNTTIVATKVLDKAGAAGAVTAPEAVGATPAAAVTDVMAFAPVVVTLEAADPIEGAGKTLEINELTSSAGRLSDLGYQLNTTKVTWVSKSGSVKMLQSSSERSVTLNVSRQYDNVVESISAGGQLALAIGYVGTTATLTVTATGLSTSVAGGAGANLSLNFSKFPTLSDLAAYINSQTGYTCKVATTLLGQKSPLMLDEVTALGICSTFGNKVGQVKLDAASFFLAVQQNSTHVQLGRTKATNVPAPVGLPATVSTPTYLTGGTKGATTEAIIQSAMDALEKLRGNFVVPLFSRDASLDIADGLTDSSSTYTIANIHAVAKTHVLKMSTMKRRRHRQAFLSIEDSFVMAQIAAAQMAHGRLSLTFQDVIHTSASGGLVQQQPWMGAVLAAGMQAAAFSKGILHRTPNQSGVLMKDGSFDPTDDTQGEQALLAGLMPLRADDTDIVVWASDQTTYSKDPNFYWNSVQAVYVGDLIALKLSRESESALVGESQADVTAPMALNVIKGILSDCRRLKLIAPSDDAPPGYKNLKVTVNGPVVEVSVEVKLAGLIYFVAINFKVSQVTQTATG